MSYHTPVVVISLDLDVFVMKQVFSVAFNVFVFFPTIKQIMTLTNNEGDKNRSMIGIGKRKDCRC